MASAPTIASASVLAGERRTVRCGACALTQFETASGKCRKCSKPLFPAPPVAEESSPTLHQVESAAPLSPAGLLQQRLRRERKALGLSQTELGQRIGVPRTYISKLEMGHATPSIRSLKRIATGLETTPARLLGEPFPFDTFVTELATFAPKLTETQRDFVLAQVRGLAKANLTDKQRPS